MVGITNVPSGRTREQPPLEPHNKHPSRDFYFQGAKPVDTHRPTARSFSVSPAAEPVVVVDRMVAMYMYIYPSWLRRSPSRSSPSRPHGGRTAGSSRVSLELVLGPVQLLKTNRPQRGNSSPDVLWVYSGVGIVWRAPTKTTHAAVPPRGTTGAAAHLEGGDAVDICGHGGLRWRCARQCRNHHMRPNRDAVEYVLRDAGAAVGSAAAGKRWWPQYPG